MKAVRILKRIFVRQSSADDCGLACLAMILNYAGKHEESIQLHAMEVPRHGFSLLELRNLSNSYGFKSRPVEMEIDYLKQLDQPCILHTSLDVQQDHYQVYFGYTDGKFILADPVTQVYELDEEELRRLWTSKAALYFEGVQASSSVYRGRWKQLLSVVDAPPALFVLTTGLTIGISTFGLLFSWFLQKTLSDDAYLQKNMLAFPLGLLLSFGLFKAVMNEIKQRILVGLNLKLNQQLTGLHLQHAFNSSKAEHVVAELENTLLDIQNMQNGISAFVSTIIAEVTIILLLLLVTIYYIPWIGLLNLFFASFTVAIQCQRMHRNVYEALKVQQLTNDYRKGLLADLERLAALEVAGLVADRKNLHINRNLNLLSTARKAAIKATKTLLYLDILSAFTLVAAVIIGVTTYRSGACSFQDVVLCTLITFILANMLPKVCTAIEVVDKAADSAIQFLRKRK